MPGYDSKKDKCLKEIGSVGNEESGIRVGVYSYDGGTPKVGIVRYNGERFAALGRVSGSEMRELLPLLEEAGKYARIKERKMKEKGDEDPPKKSSKKEKSVKKKIVSSSED